MTQFVIAPIASATLSYLDERHDNMRPPRQTVGKKRDWHTHQIARRVGDHCVEPPFDAEEATLTETVTLEYEDCDQKTPKERREGIIHGACYHRVHEPGTIVTRMTSMAKTSKASKNGRTSQVAMLGG